LPNWGVYLYRELLSDLQEVFPFKLPVGLQTVIG
jgi:hypothetical protein